MYFNDVEKLESNGMEEIGSVTPTPELMKPGPLFNMETFPVEWFPL